MDAKGSMKTYVRRRKGDSPSNVIIHLNELCRLCLAKEEEMVPIFNEDSIPLPLRIMACVNLEVRFYNSRYMKSVAGILHAFINFYRRLLLPDAHEGYI